jgi:hypothetical protein
MRRTSRWLNDYHIGTEFAQQPSTNGGELVAELDDTNSG